jgi:hypothetical protein
MLARNRSEGVDRPAASLNTPIIMETQTVKKGMIARNFRGIGPVTQDMINKRAFELAFMSGRIPAHATEAEFEQAERELAGGSELDSQEKLIEAIPESERWDPVPGSRGRQDPEPPSEDEDSEGLNESAQLVEEGVHEAEHDQMFQAEQSAQESERRDRAAG